MNVILEGRTAALFRFTLALVRKKRKEKRKLLSVTGAELMSTIIQAYLQRHEQDILEDVTDEVERLANECVKSKRRKPAPGFPSTYRNHRANKPNKVPQVPHDGGDVGAHEGRSAAPTAPAVGDKAAE